MTHELALVVNAYSLLEAGPPRALAFRCKRRPDQATCTGHLITAPWGPESAVEWCCSTCGFSGYIYDWEDSSLDLRKHVEQPEAGAELTRHELPAELFATLHERSNVTLGPTWATLLAMPVDDIVVLEADELELENLLNNISRELSFEHHSKAHLKRLERLLEILDPPRWPSAEEV